MVSPASFMEQSDGHFGALSAVATGSTAVMESLVAATNTQYNKILASMDELNNLSIAASATTGGGNTESSTGRLSPDERTKTNLCINQLVSGIKVKWGHSVGTGNSIKNCNNKTKEGETGDHNNSATRAHPSGPGRNKNKDWDNLLLWRGGP